ncbi:hypothetical protein ACFWR9_07985 [Streptomyces sp. NPDC058534]|uniref:hypothetical protein n=1 Tax=Streptomyces sp. NPDC058534 TaxID=3346541 RepID=UPI003649316A
MPTSSETVLLIEFTGLASEMSFETAFPSDSTAPVLRGDPRAGVTGDGPVDIAARAVAVAREHAGGGPYGALIANCNGALFAVHVAADLAEHGAAPRTLVLVDPLVTTGDDLRDALADLLTGLGASPAVPDELLGLKEPVELFHTVMRFLSNTVAEHLGRILEEDEDPELVAESLVGRYAAWVALLTGNLAAERLALDIPIQVLHTHDRDDLERLVDARGVVTQMPVPETVRASGTPLAHPEMVALLHGPGDYR